ncbi:MAG: SpoIIE family protein phosphatase [Crocosphaera sp.]|nr:SpoIIE family protein phosphatase [Crocosphaera sp.]
MKNTQKKENKTMEHGTSFEPEILANYELFKGVSLELIKSLLKKCQIKTLEKGETLIKAGEENHHFWILLSGELRVYLTDTGNEIINMEMGFSIFPGESIGEMSIIENEPVSANVYSSQKSQLLMMSETVFWQDLILIPGVSKNLLQGLSNRMRKRDEIALNNIKKHLELQQIQKDIQAASQIQANILPDGNCLAPNYPQIDVAATLVPARDVGGDFYDVFPIDQNHLCIAVGDVSGKGIPAALFMIRVITLLRVTMSRIQPLTNIVESINRHLCKNNDNCMFVTMFVGIIDVTSGKITYVNGGHNSPFFAPYNGAFDFLKVPTGTLLGFDDHITYNMAEFVFQPGDTLVLYTDGVTEAEDQNGGFFSNEKTCEILNQLRNEQSSQTIVSELQNAVFEFSTNQFQSDDITILVLRYRSNK